MCVPSFNLLGLTVPEKSMTKNINVWKLERKKNEEIKGKIGSSSLIVVYTYPLSTCVPNFNLLGLRVPEKSVTKNFNVWKLERRKNEEIKGWICSSLIPVYMIHLSTVHVCTKFQSSRPQFLRKDWWKILISKVTEWPNDGRTRQIQYNPHFFKARL